MKIINLTEQEYDGLKQFLLRAQLTGAEVPLFVAIATKIRSSEDGGKLSEKTPLTQDAN